MIFESNLSVYTEIKKHPLGQVLSSSSFTFIVFFYEFSNQLIWFHSPSFA